MAVLLSEPGYTYAEARPWLIQFNEAAMATFSAQSANTFYAGPTSGGSAIPAFRALVTEDLPANITISGFFTGDYYNGRSATGTSSATIGDVSFYLFTGTTASQTLTLPSAAIEGRKLSIKNISNQTVTIQRAGSDVIYNTGASSTVTSFTLVSGNQATLTASNISGTPTWFVAT